MTLNSTPTPTPGVRRLGPVSWCHDGHEGLSVTAGTDVPSFDDAMIRGALVRGALACQSIAALGRVLNRELWTVGYVARLEPDLTDNSRLLVRIASGR
jgi:hypothetical protein